MKVLITGASRGIGFEIFNQLLVEGNELVVHCNKNTKKIQDLIRDKDHSVWVFKSDLSKNDGVKGLVEFTKMKLKFPDVIINNAGIAESSPVELNYNKWLEMFDKTINVNLKSPAMICKEFIALKRKNKINKRLRIINISSRAAFRGEVEDFISYACSKGGLVALTKTISRSFGKTDNVLAFTIAPGFVNTDMASDFISEHGEGIAKKGIVLDRLTEPKDIAPIVSFIANGKIDHSTGSTIDVNGGSYLR
tara:strand:+ start:149 stop:898 length:750 start_codon:yes stop_codon:yes gene_type:complete